MDGPSARQSALVARLATPPWYHPVAGGALALLVGAFAARSATVVGGALAAYLLALYALPRAYRRSTGVWYTGATPAGALHWARRLAWTNAGAILLSALLAAVGLAVLALPAAVGAYLLVQLFGSRFDRELRRELLQDPEIAFKLEERDGGG